VRERIHAGVEYNNYMHLRAKVLLFLLILIPLALGVAGQPLPLAENYVEGQRALAQARADNDPGAEITALEALLEISPWRGDQWQRLGRLYLDTGQAQQAVASFESAAVTNQLEAHGSIWLADALVTCGRANEAKSVLVNLASNDPFVLTQAAAILRRNHFLDSSKEVLQKAYLLDPRNENINYQLGVLNMALHPADALDYLQVVKEEPKMKVNAEYLAETISAYESITLAGGWYIVAGQALSRTGEWDAAAESFRLATVADPENAIAWALLAEAQQQIGQDGLASLERALALDPRGEMVNGLAGLYYRRMLNTENALAHLQKALAANPDAAVWQIEVGGVLADAGRLEEALAAYEAAIAIDRADPESWEALAKFSLTRNYEVEEEGLPAARQLVLIQPTNPVYLDLLGTAYLTLADLDSAERFFMQALRYDPEEAAILIHLAQTSLYRGDKETAFAYLRRASASATDERLREMADRLLEENGAR